MTDLRLILSIFVATDLNALFEKSRQKKLYPKRSKRRDGGWGQPTAFWALIKKCNIGWAWVSFTQSPLFLKAKSSTGVSGSCRLFTRKVWVALEKLEKLRQQLLVSGGAEPTALQHAPNFKNELTIGQNRSSTNKICGVGASFSPRLYELIDSFIKRNISDKINVHHPVA